MYIDATEYNVAQLCILLQGASKAVIKDVMVSAA